MKEIKKNIKEKQFHRIYMLTGNEPYLIHNYKNALKNNICSNANDMNMAYSNGSDYDKLIDFAIQYPFFSDYRLIILEDFKKPTDDFIKFLDYIPETTVIIIVSPEVDKRSKLYKSVKKNGYIAELNTPNSNDLVNWIMKYANERSASIQRNVAEYLLNYTEKKMYNLSSELNKLISYSDTITQEIIDELCIKSIDQNIFDMINFATSGNIKAIDIYKELLTYKEPPIKMLILLNRQIRAIWGSKVLTGNLSKRLGKPDWVINKYKSSDLSIERLEKLILIGNEYENNIKSGLINDKTAFELMLGNLMTA